MQGVFRARVPGCGVPYAFGIAHIEPGGKGHRRHKTKQHGEEDELPPICRSAGTEYPFFAHGIAT